jgi:hypothetical protein
MDTPVSTWYLVFLKLPKQPSADIGSKTDFSLV